MPDSNRRRTLRASRSEDAETIVTARVEALRGFLGAAPQARAAAIRRLLRAERRAARCGVGYDAARHAALCRLVKEMPERPATAAPTARIAAG